MSKSIYPSIPSPGNTIDTIVPSLNAIRQCLTMLIMNAQDPSPNYTPSSSAQVFVTMEQLKRLGLVTSTVPLPAQDTPAVQGQGGHTTARAMLQDAPNDGKRYVRQNGMWVRID